MSIRHRKLRMEQMEARQMMAGDVTATLQNGTLFLTEAAGQGGLNNSVRISQSDIGKIRVEGAIASDGGTSKINGQAAQEFDVTGGLVVKFGAGNDAVRFINGIGLQINLTDINIDVADPGEIITRTPTTPIPTTYTPFRPDSDIVTLDHFQTVGSVTIKTGDGNDTVNVIDGLIGQVGGAAANLSINTGKGIDLVSIKSITKNSLITGSLDVQTFSGTEADQDFVFFEKLGVQSNLNVRTGAGDDTISMTTVGAKKLEFDAGAGVDTGNLDGVSAIDSLMAKMGEGDDTLTTSNLFANLLTLDGGAGHDKLIKNADPFFGGQRVQTGWEIINGLSVVTGATPIGTVKLA